MARKTSNLDVKKFRSKSIQIDFESRILRERHLVVCGGTETEPHYFNAINRQLPKGTIHLKVESEALSPSQLVEKTDVILQRTKHKYEDVWIVFDKDDFDDFDEAIELGKRKGYRPLYSNEAFEIWFIFHFENIDSFISRTEYEEKLTTLLRSRGERGFRYYKNRNDMFELLTQYGDLNQAISHAKDLVERAESAANRYSTINPLTNIYELMEKVLNILNENNG